MNFFHSKHSTVHKLAGIYIHAGVVLDGTIKTDQDIHFDGEINGHIATSGIFEAGANSQINANISARSITIDGIVTGQLIAPDGITLNPSAVADCDIQTNFPQIHHGAHFNGKITGSS